MLQGDGRPRIELFAVEGVLEVAQQIAVVQDPRLNHQVPATGAILEAASAALLSEFFETKRGQRRGGVAEPG